jgi:hypothetical protein
MSPRIARLRPARPQDLDEHSGLACAGRCHAETRIWQSDRWNLNGASRPREPYSTDEMLPMAKQGRGEVSLFFFERPFEGCALWPDKTRNAKYHDTCFHGRCFAARALLGTIDDRGSLKSTQCIGFRDSGRVATWICLIPAQARPDQKKREKKKPHHSFPPRGQGLSWAALGWDWSCLGPVDEIVVPIED